MPRRSWSPSRRPSETTTSIAYSPSPKPANPAINSERGTWLYHLESPWAGIADWERAVQLKPDYANGWMKLGTVYREFGQTDRARDAFRTALHVAAPDWAHREAVTVEMDSL